MIRDPEPPRCVTCDTRLKNTEGAQCDACNEKENMMNKPCPECGTPLDQVPLRECATHAQEDLKAPAPDHILDLHQRVANIIRKAYFIHTRNEQKAHETAMAVLEEVHRTYEQIAAGAAAEEQGTN